ncbi:MAG TPA: hypothetical protein VMN36_09770 [Verrucomicrobiales bacterium]|nr:hypothetical protein [Verrucomicrobiales bacterium]
MRLKPISVEAIPGAIEKAKHYRLLNEPSASESVCRDILRVEPKHQEALVILILAMCDQIGRGYRLSADPVSEVIERLESEYERAYYTGISHERRALASLRSGPPGAEFMAYDCLRDAMACYEAAERMAPAKNNDAILRWNTCARLIERNRLVPRPGDEGGPLFGE